MTKSELVQRLESTQLFTREEIWAIVRACGTYTIGNAIIACEICGIELTGNDVDIMIGA